MSVLLLGGGMMGVAIAQDLIENNIDVTIADKSADCVKTIPNIEKNADFILINADDTETIKKTMKNSEVTISALPYDFNYMLAKTAVACRTHFCDLGGNSQITERELKLHEKAKNAGVLIVPDCGLAPGITNVMSSYLVKKIHGIKKIHIRVGGLPQSPQGTLSYALFFSVHGLINEYVEKAKILIEGRVTEVEALTGIEEIKFPSFSHLEAFYTSGGTSTLPNTFKGKIQELDYKTIRYRGHCEKIKVLKDLGFFKKDMRMATEGTLEKSLEKNVPDVVLARVTGSGKTKIKLELIDYFDDDEQITAMMRTTGYPTSIIAQMILKGTITEKGSLPPEKCIPPEPFFEELMKRNIKIKER